MGSFFIVKTGIYSNFVDIPLNTAGKLMIFTGIYPKLTGIRIFFHKINYKTRAQMKKAGDYDESPACPTIVFFSFPLKSAQHSFALESLAVQLLF